MLEHDLHIRWPILAAMLLICLARPCDAFAQSVTSSMPEPSRELKFNFTDEDTIEYSDSESTPDSASTPITAAPTTPIHWNLSDQPTADECKRELSLARAGYPQSISKRAATTYNQKYVGYFVGGGVPPARFKNRSRGEPGYRHEGTWGMDYAPFYSRVAANWSHGRLFQGGIGQYEPDHKNRPFGQTFGKHFGNRDRSIENEQHAVDVHREPWSPFQLPVSDQ